VPKPVENSKKPVTDGTGKPPRDEDAIPLFDGSRLFVSKAALAKAYIPMPAIYTFRVMDLVIGKEKLALMAQRNEDTDKDLLQDVIST